MILKKVSVKKKWRYEYDDLEEMIGHYTSMVAALFRVEHYDEEELVAIYSQTIDEIHSDEHVAADEIIYANQGDEQHGRQ